MSAVIGVDLGSTSVRALALDEEGRVLGIASASYAPGAPAGRADPSRWMRAVETALSELTAGAQAARAPAACCVGGQSPTTVPPQGLAVTCTHPVGATLDPSGQHQAQLALLRDEQPGLAGGSQVYDYVLEQLGADAHQARWPDDPLLEDFGPPAPTGSVVGAARAGALPAGTPLVAGAQDAYLTFLAAGLDTPGRACDPGGRTGGLGVAVADATCPPGLFRLAGPAKGTSIVGGPVNAHGLAIDWCGRLTGRSIAELLELAGDVAPGADGVGFLPYLEGERAPRFDRGLRAEFVGLTTSTGPGELARAVLEGTAYGLAHIARVLASSGVGIDVLVCAGSPARSRLWCEIKASVLEVPVEVPAVAELAAYGAALAAGAGVGWWPRPGEAGPGAWPRPAAGIVEARALDVYREGLDRFIALGDEAVRRNNEWRDR